MLLRALVAFAVLPGVVAFLLPWLIAGDAAALRAARPLGLGVLLAGTAGLLWCAWAFYATGKGTLAPLSPPSRLVVVGLYRYSRNPMYVSVLLVLAGWAIVFASPVQAAYAALVAVAFHLRVVLGEEPVLARIHGVEWEAYTHRVHRWLGRVREGGGGP